jgi:hypothetical protein
MEINPKLVKGLSGAELHASAMYHRFPPYISMICGDAA